MKHVIKQKSLSEHIEQDLEDKILDGSLNPGQRIVEGELCKTYGVSQTPVREAFRLLENKGFVIWERRKGISVAKITEQEIVDIYHIRAALEGMAVHLAVKIQNPKILKRLKTLHDKMIKAAADEHHKMYDNLDRSFHETMIKACANKRLIQLIDTFYKQTLCYRVMVSSRKDLINLPGHLKASTKRHKEIIQAFESGNAKKGETLRKKNILNNVPRIAQSFKMDENRC